MSEQKRKRFALFAGDKYYPQGGGGDHVGNFESIDEALQNYMSHHDWLDILDLDTGEWVTPWCKPTTGRQGGG